MTLPLDTAPYFMGTDLTYAATGLPDGLAIAAQSGLITGAPTTPQTRAVTVTAANAAGSAQQNFSWTILAGGGALSVQAFDHGNSGSISQAVTTFPGLLAAPGDVILAVSHRGNPLDNPATGVTVDGVAASVIGRQYASTGTKQETSFWQATVTGSTASVEVTTAAATSRVGVALWSVGTLGAAPVFTSVTDSSIPDLTGSIDVAAGGLMLGHVTATGGGANISWTGLDSDYAGEASPNYPHAAASRSFTAAATGETITASFDGTYGNAVLGLVALAP